MGLITLPQRFTSQPQYSPILSPAYQDAEILSLFNDGTGKDLAKGNHLIPGSAPTPVIRQTGRVLDFNGSSTYLLSTRTIMPGAVFTVFAWVRPDNTNSGYTRIIETTYNTGFYLGANSGTQYAWIVNNSSLEGCIGGQQVIGQRDFVCGVFDGTNRILYVNGVQVGSASATAPSTALTVTVGRAAGGSGYWSGGIGPVGIFNRAFSASDVATLNANPWQLVQAPPRRIFAVSTSFNSYTITPNGGIVFAGTAPTAKQKFYVITPSGGITFGGTNGIIGTRTFTISPSGGITFGGTGSMTSSNAQTYIITPTGGITFSGGAVIVKTNIILPTGGIVFSGSAPITSNTVISTVTTRLPLTGVGG